MKTKIKKYIRKYIPVICTLLFVPILSISSYAYTSYDTFPATVPFQFNYSNGKTVVNGGSNLIPDSNNVYTASNNRLSGIIAIDFGPYTSKSFYFPVDNDNFDYYFLASFIGDARNFSDFTFFPSYLFVKARNHQDRLEEINISDVSFYHTDGLLSKGFSVSCKLDLGVYNCIDAFSFDSNTAGTIPAGLRFEVSVVALPKSMTSDDAQMAIISAINSQTSVLGEKLDGIDSGIDKGNDLIENGNEGTQSAVSDFNEVFEDFNSELDTWEQFDDDIIGEFNNANDNYMAELNNFSLSGSLLNAGTWLSTSMQTVYDNSSDYKMLWLVPLLFGIPILLFIIRKNGDDE